MKKLIAFVLNLFRIFKKKKPVTTKENTSYEGTQTNALVPRIRKHISISPIKRYNIVSKARKKNNRKNTLGRLTQRIGRKTIKHYL